MSMNTSPERTGLKIGTALRDSRLRRSPERQSVPVSQELSFIYDLKREFDRIADSGAFIIRAVDSLSKTDAHALDIDVDVVLNDIEREEEYIFSPIPHYLQSEWKRMVSENESAINDVVTKLDTVGRLNEDGKLRADYSESARIVIDPSVPLLMPFSKERYHASPQRKTAPSCYHSLFFGEGEPVVFVPPENNKRKDIEKLNKEREYWKKKFQRAPRSDVVEQKKTIKVPNDFVPSCAQVDHSLVQQELQKRNEIEKNKAKKETPVKRKTVSPAH
ncbi:hypothetical protein C3747_9g131 [Trypanosoma cruzi]|uniref:Uncharacterized protein n=1 Tax=Trypanosoma cruzi TaxID=5693 RepID=A0A2V2XLM4_TRYCR|nr:hypothetical protein C3747_9g131 [Trypanosoma cruzi]